MNLFVVHGWHTPKTSLYPHLCDGIEYIDGAIEAIRRAAKEADIKFNIDHESFVSGETLRINLKKNIEGADIVIVLLDGLRPNIVYELGYAEATISINSKKGSYY